MFVMRLGLPSAATQGCAAQPRAFAPLGTVFLAPTFKKWKLLKIFCKICEPPSFPCETGHLWMLFDKHHVSKVNWKPSCVVDVAVCEELLDKV